MACNALVNGITLTECGSMAFNSDALFQFLDALNEADTPPSEVTGATVTVSFTDHGTGLPILGPVPMPEVSPPSNDYQTSVFIDAANGFAAGQIVLVTIDFDGGPGLKAQRSSVLPVVA